MRTLAATTLALILVLAVPVAPAEATDGCVAAPDDAGVYAFPADCSGEVLGGFGTPADVFQFHVPERARLVFHVTNAATGWGQSILVDLYDPEGNVDIGPTVWGGETSRAGAVAEGPGVWKLVLDGFSMEDTMIPYSFTARLEPAPPPFPPQDDCASGGDAPSSWASMPIALPVACAGELRYTDDIDGYGNDGADRYSFSLDVADSVAVTLTLDEGVSACLHLDPRDYSSDGVTECRRVPAGNASETFELTLGMDEPTWGALIFYRAAAINTTYAFTATPVGPVWHEQVAHARVELGAPQMFGGHGAPDRRLILNQGTLPEGYLVEWIRLDRPVQPRGEIHVSFDTPYPAEVRALITDDEGREVMRCGGADANRTIRCDRTTDSSWDSRARWAEPQWVAIVVDHGVEVDATMTFRHWTRA